MEKLVLFPLNNDIEVLIKNWEENEQYQIVAVSSYYEDRKRLDLLREEKAFYCSTDFIKCLEEADSVVFAENTMGYSYSGYSERVQQAQKAGKKIYLSATLLDNIKVDFENGDLHILQENMLLQNLDGEINIREIDVPIISVMGMGENCDKFNLQLKIRGVIEKQGYNVLTISSNVLGKFLGLEILPGFLFSRNISYPEKIKAFNLWIYRLLKKTKPDIILIGCPGGISEFENYETNFYGEIPLIIANSISIDAGFVTLYANMEQDVNSAKKISDFAMIKYNTEVEDYIISKQFFKIDYEWRKVRYYRIDERRDAQNDIITIPDCYISYIEDDLKIEKQVINMLTQFENNFYVI